jgi:hypothetical protein
MCKTADFMSLDKAPRETLCVSRHPRSHHEHPAGCQRDTPAVSHSGRDTAWRCGNLEKTGRFVNGGGAWTWSDDACPDGSRSSVRRGQGMDGTCASELQSTMEGWLKSQQHGGYWSEMFFRLDGGRLFFSNSRKLHFTEVKLRQYACQYNCSAQSKDHPFCFELVPIETTEAGAVGVRLVLAAETEALRSRWVNALNRGCCRWATRVTEEEDESRNAGQHFDDPKPTTLSSNSLRQVQTSGGNLGDGHIVAVGVVPDSGSPGRVTGRLATLWDATPNHDPPKRPVLASDNEWINTNNDSAFPYVASGPASAFYGSSSLSETTLVASAQTPSRRGA